MSVGLRRGRFVRLFCLNVFLPAGLMAHSLLVSCAQSEVVRGPYLSWVNDPHTTITVSWQTTEPVRGWIEYGLDTTDTDTVRDRMTDTLHTIEITDLEPSATYYYRLASGKQFHSFSTAVTSGLPFTFCVFGDTRSDSAAHKSVVDRIVGMEPDFAINVGDLVASGSSMSDWNTFFNIERNLLKSMPFMPSIGNHESPLETYFELFHLPGNERWYSFNYGNAHFVALDTEHNLAGDQRAWLELDLASANADSAIDWIFVYFHRPPYTSGKHSSSIPVREAWCGLFEAYDVDLVFGGHNHFYQRTRPINGVTYVITGGGGAPLCDPGNESWIVSSQKAYHCCMISVNGFLLKMEVIEPGGKILDSFEIRRVGARTEVAGITRCIYQDYPNPFSQLRTISYHLPVKAAVLLSINDVSGKLVRTLVDDEKDAGNYSVSFNGERVEAGIYFAKFEAGDYTSTKKLILVR